MVGSHLHGNFTAPRLALDLCVYYCSVVESPAGDRQPVTGCVLSGGTAAFSCSLHLSHPLLVYSYAYLCNLRMQLAAASLLPSSLPQLLGP